jgi:hypothetical protein
VTGISLAGRVLTGLDLGVCPSAPEQQYGGPFSSHGLANEQQQERRMGALNPPSSSRISALELGQESGEMGRAGPGAAQQTVRESFF